MGWQDAPVISQETQKVSGSAWESAPVVGETAEAKQGSGFLDAVYENVIGRGEVDTPGERLGEMVRGGGAAVARGIIDAAAIPGTMVDIARSAGSKLGNKAREAMGNEPLDGQASLPPLFERMPNSSQARAALSGVTGGESDYVAPGTSGEYIATAGEFAGSAGAFGGPGVMLKYGAVPGVASEAAGQATEGMQFPEGVPLVGGRDVEPFARVASSLAAPVALGAAEKTLRRVITPNPADPARTQAAKQLADEGIQTTAGQRTGSAPLKYREDAVPRTQQILSSQDEQFTQAVLKRIGVDAKRAEPEVMRAAAKRIGGVFDDLSSRNNISPDADLLTVTRQIVDDYGQLTAKSNIAPIIRNVQDKIGQSLMSGAPISGKQYQAWRTQLGRVTRGTDGQLRDAAADMIGALDDAMGRTLQAANRVDDLALYSTARSQWRDYLAIEKAVSSAGSETALGIINPRQLRSAVSTQGRGQYVRGQRDLGELSRAGNVVMSPLPNSGTAQRLGSRIMQSVDSGAGVGGGSLAYLLTKDPQIAAASAAVGSVLPAARNALAGTRAGQAYLGNQMVGPGGSVVDQRMMNALAALAAQSGN